MITRLIWTPMSSVPKKTDKLNLPLSLSLVQLHPFVHSTRRLQVSIWLVLGETADFSGSIQQRAFQLLPSWLSVISSISSGTSCNRPCFYLEDWLELASSYWVPEFPGVDAMWELSSHGEWEWWSHTLPWGAVSHTPHKGFFLWHFFKAAYSHSLEKCVLCCLFKSFLTGLVKSLV